MTDHQIPLASKAIRIWLRLLLILLFILIVWGALVRLTGSGLSIPEWPIVNGSILPPLSDDDWQAVYRTYYLEVHNISDPYGPDVIPVGKFKTMFAIEYLHRMLAAVAGIIFIVLYIRFMRDSVKRKRVGYLMTLAGALLLLQIVLGAVVVKEELKAELVAGHLAVAYLFYALILWIYLRLNRATDYVDRKSGAEYGLILPVWLMLVSFFFQFISGGLMAGSGAGHILNTYPKMGGHWIPPLSQLYSSLQGGLWSNLVENRVLIQFIHRWWILAVIAMIVWTRVKARRYALSRRGKTYFRIVDILLVLQIVWGIGNLVMKVPVYMSAGHSGIALLLFTFSLMAAYEAGLADKK